MKTIYGFWGERNGFLRRKGIKLLGERIFVPEEKGDRVPDEKGIGMQRKRG